MAKKQIQSKDLIQDNVLKKTIAEFNAWGRVIQKVEKDLIDLAKTTKQGIFKIDSKDVDSVKTLNNQVSLLDSKTKLLNESRKKQKTTLTELERANQRLKQAQSSEAQRLAKVKARIQEVNKANREQAKTQIKLLSPYRQASKNLNELRKRYKDLAVQNKQNTKEGQRLLKNITRLDTKLKAIDKTVGQNQRNVGNYSDAIGEAVKETGLFGRELALLQTIQRTVNKLLKISTNEQKANAVATTTNAKATKKLTIAQKGLAIATKLSTKVLKAFKIALASTGIGAIVIALGTLFTYLTRTQGGINKLEQATTALSTTFDVLIDRFSSTGEAFALLFSGDFTKAFEKFKESFKGIGDEIKEENKLANESIKIQQKLRVEFAQFIAERSIGEKKISKLRLLARDEENKDLGAKLSGLIEAFDLEEDLANKSIRLKKSLLAQSIVGGDNAKTQAQAEQLINDVLEGRTKLNIENLGLANSLVEDLEDANNQIAEINKESENQFNRQRSLQREIDRLKNLINKGSDKQIKKEKEVTGLINKQRALVSKLRKEKGELNEEGLIIVKQEEIDKAEKELKRLESLGIKIKIDTGNEEERIKEANANIKQILLDRQAEDIKIQGKTLDETLKNINNKEDAEIKAIQNKFKRELEAEGLLAEEKAEIQLKEQLEIEDIKNKNEGLRNDARDEDLERLKNNSDEVKELYSELQDSITDALDEALNARYEKIQANLDRELEANKKQQDRLQELADNGDKNALESLQDEREREQEIEKEKIEKEKELARVELAIGIIKSYASNDGDLAKTIVDTTLLKTLITSSFPSFEKGTEDTGTNGKGIDGKGGSLNILHPNEGVIKKEDNVRKLKAGLTNKQAIDYAIAYQHLKPKKEDIKSNNVSFDFTSLEKAIKDLPNNMPIQELYFDEQEKAYVHITKQNGKINRTHKRSNGLFR